MLLNYICQMTESDYTFPIPDKGGTEWKPLERNGFWGVNSIWCYEASEIFKATEDLHSSDDLDGKNSSLLNTYIMHHDLSRISESDEETDSESTGYHSKGQTRVETLFSPGEKIIYDHFHTKFGTKGIYSSDEEDEEDPLVSVILKCRADFEALDPNRPPKLVLPKVPNWPGVEEKERLHKYAKHFGVRVDADGGIYTSGEETEVETAIEIPKVKVRPPKKVKRKKDPVLHKFFKDVQRFSQVSKKDENDRRRIYREFNIHRLIPINAFTIDRCIELLDCMFAALEDRPGIVFYCAEFCKFQYELLPSSLRGVFLRAILRCIKDSTVYVTRLLSLVIFKWTSLRPGSNFSANLPPGLTVLRKWMKHLRKADYCPPYVVADINILLTTFTKKGKFRFANYARLNNCEIKSSGDDLVLITKNSYGRKLFCCREILSLYSYTFYQFFYHRYIPGKKELHLDVEFCAMREILRVLYHCDRKFTSVHFQQYGEAFLLQIAKAALQLDFPLIYRLCEEQLLQHSGLGLALKAFNVGLPGITSRCLPFMDAAELHDLLKFVLYGQHISNELHINHATELDTICSTLGCIRLRHPRKFFHSDPQAELIFPLDFTTPWVMSDIVIETVGSGGRFLFVNRAVMAIFSSFFREYPYSKARKWRGHWRIPTNEKYATVRAALRILHHVKQKFISQRLPTLLPTMLVRLYRCSTFLDFPLIHSLCEEQLEVAPMDYIFTVIRLVDPTLPCPLTRPECLVLVKKALRAE